MATKKQKCVKCQQALVYYSLVLMNGPNGFRRYALCDRCRAEILEHEGRESSGRVRPCERREKIGRN